MLARIVKELVLRAGPLNWLGYLPRYMNYSRCLGVVRSVKGFIKQIDIFMFLDMVRGKGVLLLLLSSLKRDGGVSLSYVGRILRILPDW